MAASKLYLSIGFRASEKFNFNFILAFIFKYS